MWEQEDASEGPGLGLALTPASGLRPPRRVWSRSMTFDVDVSGDSRGSDLHKEDAEEEEGSDGLTGSSRGEVALSFSVCLLPTGVDVLLCSQVGVWMPAGARVVFNNFATGRLPNTFLPPIRLPIRSSSGGCESGCPLGISREVGQDDPEFTDSESDSDDDGEKSATEDDMEGGVYVDDSGYEDEEYRETDDLEERRQGTTNTSPAARGRRLFAVHDTTGDLMVYHHVGATMLAVSLPSGGGGLRLRLQCRLDQSSPPPPPPQCLAVRLNVAVLAGGGVCSAYDLCTGRLLGATSIPRCRACTLRRRHHTSGTPPGFLCSCGRRQRRQRRSATAGSMEGHPVLWTSATRGHLMGVFMATQNFRLRLPGAEACLEAILAPMPKGEKGVGALRWADVWGLHRKYTVLVCDGFPPIVSPWRAGLRAFNAGLQW